MGLIMDDFYRLLNREKALKIADAQIKALRVHIGKQNAYIDELEFELSKLKAILKE